MVRTDLALEAAERHFSSPEEAPAGCEAARTEQDGFAVHELRVMNEEGARAVGKPCGRYVTVETGELWNADKSAFTKAAAVLAGRMATFFPAGEGVCLLAALGNKAVTADAVGPIAAEHFLVTAHIRKSDPALFREMGLRETVCISPGVLGTTGIEAVRVIAGTVREVKPSFVVAVDALASKRLSRLATTVQICDTGISPGSGIYNARPAIGPETLGVPVIAVGVPTVVEASTLAYDLLAAALARRGAAADAAQALEAVLKPEARGFFVTPKETDRIIRTAGRLVAYALNRALQPSIGFEEMEELLG